MSTLTLDPIGSDALDLRPAAPAKACGCSKPAVTAAADPLVSVSPDRAAVAAASAVRFTVSVMASRRGAQRRLPGHRHRHHPRRARRRRAPPGSCEIAFASRALTGILPFFAISIALAAMAKATGAEVLISRAFVDASAA